MASWTTAQSPCLITLKILSFMVFFLSRVSSLYTTLVTYPKVNMNGRYFSLQSSRPCIRQRSSGSPLRNGKSERRVHPNQKLRQWEDPNGLTTKQTGPPPPPLIHHTIPPLIVGDANLGSVIAAVGATIAGKERIAGTVVRSAIGVEDAFVRLAVELLVAEEAKLPRCRPLDVRLVYVQHGYSFRRRTGGQGKSRWDKGGGGGVCK